MQYPPNMKTPPHCVTWLRVHPVASVVKSSECTSCHCCTPLTLTPPTASTDTAMTCCEPRRSVFAESSTNNGVLCDSCWMTKFAAESRPSENSEFEPRKILAPSASVLATFNERIVKMPRGLSCGPATTGSTGVGGHPGSSFGTPTIGCMAEARGCGPPGPPSRSVADSSEDAGGGGGIVGIVGETAGGGAAVSSGGAGVSI
mmetsp:Transcript_46138/g.91482  ORF Transcript_46138/g.91482 Transcript_46138/m.91482 type:complete len:202 (+) Transcript_46138:422-1027(+)